jgi:hypothetical protein
MSIGVWQGVAMDSLKFLPGQPCLTLLTPVGGPPINGLTAVSGVARPQNGRPAAFFYPFGHPIRLWVYPWKKHIFYSNNG